MAKKHNGNTAPVTPQDVEFVAFVERVKRILAAKQIYEIHPNGSFVRIRRGKPDTVVEDNDPHLFIRWETGGSSGGSCWGGESSMYHTDNVAPEFASLDAVLEDVKPDLFYLQYKRLVATLVQADSYTEDEYYGNSTTYNVKKVRLFDLFLALRKEGWLS